MAKVNVRVEIPGDPTDLLTLAAKIEAQHVILADSSPLKALEDAASFPSAVTRATVQDNAADAYSAKAETAIGERKKDMPAVIAGVRARRDALLAAYRSNPKKLTEFGFNVSDSPADNGPAAPAPTGPGK